MSLTNLLYLYKRRKNFVDQYLQASGIDVYQKIVCSNGLCKVLVPGKNITLEKLNAIFFSGKNMPALSKKDVCIDKFKCDGNKFSFLIHSLEWNEIDEIFLKSWWRDKQIDSILND